MRTLSLAALLTFHGKGGVLSHQLAKAGYAVSIVSDFDTDSLGTFSGEIAREGMM